MRFQVTLTVPGLSPGGLSGALRVAGRETTDAAMGAAIDLLPLEGEVITEIEAFRLLYRVEATVIASGGIQKAEGGKTFVLEGEPGAIRRAGADVWLELLAPGRGAEGIMSTA